jgi:hypothetical protein
MTFIWIPFALASFEVTRLQAGKLESIMPLVRKYQIGS